jgi:hypothetical protein
VTEQLTFRISTRSVRPFVRHRIVRTEMADAEAMSAFPRKRTFAGILEMSAKCQRGHRRHAANDLHQPGENV